MMLHLRRDSRRGAIIAGSALIFLMAQIEIGGGQTSSAVVVPRLDIPVGTVIMEPMIEVRTEPVLSLLSKDHIMSSEDVVGRIARALLPAGRAIKKSSLRRVPSMQVGEFVEIVFEANGVFAKAQGLSLQAGGVGDTIRVRNVRTGIVVIGKVGGSKQVMVDQP
jgi:flagellar basal body P-ring formation protein FlgA